MKTEDNMSMYDYNVGQGKTMYEILGEKYYPELNGNFSTKSLFINFLHFTSKNIHGFAPYKPVYIKTFKSISDLLYSRVKKGNGKFNKEFLKEFKSRLQKVAPKGKKFSELDDYFEYTNRNLQNSNTYDLQEEIISTYLDTATLEEDRNMKVDLLGYAYCGHAMTQLKNLCNRKDAQPTEQDFQDLEEIKFMSSVFTSAKRTEAYDNFLNQHKMQVDEFSKKLALSLGRVNKRDEYVSKYFNYIIDDSQKSKSNYHIYNMDEASLEQKNEFLVNEIIAQKPKGPSLYMTENSYRFKVDEYATPKTFLSESTTYSKDGDENQFVIATALGACTYESYFNGRKPAASSISLELVAVTKIDKPLSNSRDDANSKNQNKKTYFILMPVDRLKVLSNSTDAYIPSQLHEYYTNIYFSDYYLKNIEKNNFRFAGNVVMDSKRKIPTVNASYLGNKEDIRAALYASKYNVYISSPENQRKKDKRAAKVSRVKYDSLNDYLRTSNIMIKHLICVSEIEKKASFKEFAGLNVQSEKFETQKIDINNEEIEQ